MENNFVTITDLNQMKDELIKTLEQILALKSTELPVKKWLKSHEVRTLLGISPGTLQNLRINGTLPFSKFGGAIYYDYEDIMKKMNENRIHNDFSR
jgi:hypothetical protein